MYERQGREGAGDRSPPRSGGGAYYIEKTVTSSPAMRIFPVDSRIIDARLVVLVITNDDPVYEMNRKIWSLLARERSGIRVYFVMGKPDLPGSSPFLVDEDASMLYIRTEESSVPGILRKTVEALRWLLLSRRHNFKYILRTNMSSMWCWKRLMAHLHILERAYLTSSGMVAGVLTKLNDPDPKKFNITFVSGAGILMDRDAAITIVERSAELSYHIADDVAMSMIWNSDNTQVLPLNRCDFVNDSLTLPLDLSRTCYHWRVKNPKDRNFYDGYILSRLYAELYSTDPLLPTKFC